MIRRFYQTLPGPTAVRLPLALLLLTGGLVALHFFYEWLGALVLDTGGAIT